MGMCCDATIAVNALLPVKGTLIHLLCVDGATWSWWQPRQLALGRVGAFRLKSFSETGLKSTACWVTERGDVCFPSLMLFVSLTSPWDPLFAWWIKLPNQEEKTMEKDWK